jgi:hypothetical protein
MLLRLRRLSVGVAVALAFGALFAQSVALPSRVTACSCAGPPGSLAEVVRADAGQVAIVVGTVGVPLRDRTPVAVDSWFHGASPAEVVWLSGGTEMVSSCDISMKPGERRLLVLFGTDDGLYSANTCAPGGVVGTPDGDALLREATRTFGGQPPATAEPEAPPAQGSSASVSAGLLWILAAIAVAGLLFGAAAVAASRRARL